MPGGLIQIVAYGSQDIYLTSVPEITFFKVVYRKYTNFSMEAIEIPLNGTPAFDRRSITTIPKNGDLIHKLYLKIDIPTVHLIVDPSHTYVDNVVVTAAKANLATNRELHVKYLQFFKYNFIILNGLMREIKTIGSNWYTVNDLINKYKVELLPKINAIHVILDDCIFRFNITFPPSSKSMYYGSDINNAAFINAITAFISSMITYFTSSENTLLNTISSLEKGINNLTTQYEYFAWVKRLGFFIINHCSILIGGQEIVKFDGNFLDIFYSLNNKQNMHEQLNEMIGNIPSLTDYTNTSKHCKTLYIPLPTWFSEHSGNSLPLISLVYHDVEVAVEINSLNQCCMYNGKSNLNNLIKLGSCSLIVDYIFLDTDERKKFAQFSHEYLVQSVQKIETNILNIKETSLELEVEHPVKELYWYIREQKYITQNKLFNVYYVANIYNISFISATQSSEIIPSITIPLANLTTIYFDRTYNVTTVFNIGDIINIQYSKYYDDKYCVIYSTFDYVVIEKTYVQYTNYHDNYYGIIYNDPKNGLYNPINIEYILFDGQNRTPKIESKYYNDVIPYQYYKNNTYDGVNAYSFSLYPRDLQPSGSANLGIIKSRVLQVELNENFYNYIIEQETSYKLVVYAINYNILRIHGGMATLIFSA